MKYRGAITLGGILFIFILGFFFRGWVVLPGAFGIPVESFGRKTQPHLLKKNVATQMPPENKAVRDSSGHPDMKKPLAACEKNRDASESPQENQNLDLSLLDKDPAAAYVLLLKQKGIIHEEHFDNYQQTILLEWAKKDPAAAAGQFFQLGPGPARDQLIRGLAIGWSDQDVSKAFEWLLSPAMRDVPNDLMEQCFATIITKYAAVDPVAASRLVGRLDAESVNLQVQLVHPVITHYAELNFNQALTWALNLENQTARNIGVVHLLDQFGLHEGEEILTVVFNSEDKLTPYTLSAVFEQLAKTIPVQTAEELTHLPAHSQSVVTASFAASWLANDPQAAMSWFAVQPDGPVFEVGAATIADRIMHDDFASAFAWANSISNPTNRFYLILRVVNNTNKDQLGAVYRCLNDLSISSGERNLLHEIIKGRLAAVSFCE